MEQDAETFRPAKRLKAALAPNVFAQFTALAKQHGAANLGQGFPSFGSPRFLQDAVMKAMQGDVFATTGAPESLGNQYTRPGGEPNLAETLARLYGPRFNRTLDPLKEIVTTIGAQEAIFTSLFSWTDPGDEVLLFTPCFDAVVRSASTLQVKLIGVNLRPPCDGSTASLKDWSVNMEELERSITPQTRILMFNTPSAPFGKVFRQEELEAIAEVVRRHPRILVISDEVYERCVYDNVSHFHFASLPGMFERTMTLFSVGKTFSCTGWRVGYIIAPSSLAAPLLASHTAVNFCAPTPLQKASAAAFDQAEKEGYFEWFPKMMQEKRDFLVKVLQEVGLKPLVPEGGYFIICDATIFLEAAHIDDDHVSAETPLDERPDVKVCKWMTEKVGVTAIPVSPFYLPESRHYANRLVRLAFCKDEATMSLAAERLKQWHVPPYGFALLYSRWEVTGAARRIQNCTPREICRLLHHTTWSLMWCVPAVTYVIIRVVEHREETYDSQMGLFSILVIHYVVSAIGIGIGLFYPIWDSDAIWPLTRVSVLTQFSRFVFWGLVLMVKCVLAYYGLISKMLRSVSKLRLSQYSSSHVFAQAGWRGLLLNAPLSRDFVEECGIWGAAFFLFFADTPLGSTARAEWLVAELRGRAVWMVSFLARSLRVRLVMVCNDSSDDDVESICMSKSTERKGSKYEEIKSLPQARFVNVTSRNGHAPQPSPMGQAIAKSIWEWRICLAIGWPLLAVLMAPFAYMMVINALPLPKNPPHGTPSALAEELFEAKFPYLVGMKMEMVLIKCRAPCESAVSSVSKSHVEILKDMVLRFGHEYPGTIIDIRSYYTFGTKIDDNPMLSFDKQSILFVWSWRVNGTMKLEAQDFARQITRMCDSLNEQLDDGPLSYQLAATGPTFLNVAMKETVLHEVPIHEIETLWLPFGILAYRLQSARLLLLALCSMPVSILISFGFMYFVSTQLPVILYALVMMLMLCTALSFDYSLFTMTRYGEERRKGTSLEDAIAIVITQSGHVVVVSGLVLTIAYGSLLVLPGAFKSFCIAACSMILCCIGVQMTFVPCLLGIFPWLGAGFDVVSPEEEADEGDASWTEEEEEDIGHEELEEDTPATRNSLRHVRVFRKGIYYRVGGKLTQCPLNILVPIAIYAVTSPLTYRVLRYQMGHAYELQIPRGKKEWETSLSIQQDFPTSVGCMMPTLIIATSKLPDEDLFTTTLPPLPVLPSEGLVVHPAPGRTPAPGTTTPSAPSTQIRRLNETAAVVTVPTPAPKVAEAPKVAGEASEKMPIPDITSEEPLDVRGQAFFNENCDMVNRLIQMSRNETFALASKDFQSPTFYGELKNGDVKCLNYKLTHYYRENFFAKRFMSTSRLMQKLWDQLVNAKHDSMLTLLTPKMDPFSEEAFRMTSEIRSTLHNASVDSRESGFGAITYMMFSPSAIMMDMIKFTHDRLFVAFLGCAIVCFVLIAVAFHAWLIPFKLLFTVILPITWTYGAALYVYEDGALEWLGFPGLSPTYITNSGPAGLDWTVPMFTLTIMLGLALDYDVFLFERVWEFREEGFGDNESVQLALSATGPTITAAGLIFAFTFTSMLLGSMAITNQMGFIFIFSIVVDTFVVRTVLVPAMLSLNPRLNYWPSDMPEVKITWLGK
ncbi:unnamed protein product [Durusdinium trenchii]|uniref:SSD domain-containing protein n=1 Tax=Durusdinium trenchii TaxID=1381693 RepID=A0ABP0PCU3_9DINO